MADNTHLAHEVLDACQTQAWLAVIRPYIERERDNTIKLMAFATDPLQLMRYAGAMQALNNLMEMEAQAKKVVEGKIEQKLQSF